MALPISVPYSFANATTSIPLSQLDTDISTVYAAVNGIGNGTVALSNVSITGGNGTFTTITSPASTNLTIQSASTTALTIDTSQNVTAVGTVAMASSFKRNRIINGNMLIDQRNAGAAQNNATIATYCVDRFAYFGSTASKFSIGQNVGSAALPAGFTNYLGLSSLAATTPAAADIYVLGQRVEGYNIADLAWGTANAKTVTLSFWVQSSATGIFGGSLVNSSINRCYVFSYTISSANTWEYKTITVSGDTSGTWLTTNGTGIILWFNFASGSTNLGTAGSWGSSFFYGPTGAVNVLANNGATFYITGVQLEVGTKATPYEMQIYSDQLAQCQRYFEILPSASSGIYGTPGAGVNVGYANWQYKVTKRTSPTVTLASGSLITFDYANEWGCSGYAASGSYPYIKGGTTASAEL